jgi:hypothetical protein
MLTKQNEHLKFNIVVMDINKMSTYLGTRSLIHVNEVILPQNTPKLQNGKAYLDKKAFFY